MCILQVFTSRLAVLNGPFHAKKEYLPFMPEHPCVRCGAQSEQRADRGAGTGRQRGTIVEQLPDESLPCGDVRRDEPKRKAVEDITKFY